jgi:hypothetical protein
METDKQWDGQSVNFDAVCGQRRNHQSRQQHSTPGRSCNTPQWLRNRAANQTSVQAEDLAGDGQVPGRMQLNVEFRLPDTPSDHVGHGEIG